ncbi:hypothetical protein EGH82_00655 [Vibrio ponticus]|uniref:Uncharacterized protein n=1 Tax=Vibrio ponticus TaxID=265668 RepID=A0A3N3E777_9VIBR|nr:hypothetical protein EGH82_00170 [Vibrio ponticus]ROV62577.1 hypothetical protein EGH82_00655 [Vibrio ponticus]
MPSARQPLWVTNNHRHLSDAVERLGLAQSTAISAMKQRYLIRIVISPIKVEFCITDGFIMKN